jgi:SAM-dependent methyltransferase
MSAVAAQCRGCGNERLETILDLGRTPLANNLLKKSQLKQPEPFFPLVLMFCPACSLLQISETVPPEILFRHYLYFSSVSDALLCHAQELAQLVMQERALDKSHRVIEIASNDGYLLQYYREAGIPVLGIEPATNVAAVAREERGIPTINEFFGLELAKKLRAEHACADVIHAHNVLAHIDDLNGFVAGLGLLLKDDGVVVIEVPYVKDMIDRVEFDTIYHEHLSYFSLTALNHLCVRHGLRISSVKQLPIHGGSLRVFMQHEKSRTNQLFTVERLLLEEKQWGVDSPAFYLSFQGRVQRVKAQLLDLLHGLKLNGDRIAAYGCSAKGSTLLNYCGIGRETLAFVVDRSPAKQGLRTPGSHLPVYAPEELLEEMPEYALLLTWNFADEILQQQSEYQRRGGQFILPIPEPRIVSGQLLEKDTVSMTTARN